MSSDPLLSINNIEVTYNRVILALRGVSLQVHEGSIVSLLGANGAGKTTTLKACSNLLAAERGQVSKGSIEYLGSDIASDDAYGMVKRGMVQVLEGRHCFAHLTVEENLLTGSFIRENRAEAKRDLERVYEYFPRIKVRRKSQAGFTSGGEQQMIAIGRALMSRPKLILLDEPSMGIAPQLVEEVFEIVRNMNQKDGVSFLVAEQNAVIALKYATEGYVMENGRVMMRGSAKELLDRPDVKELYLGTTSGGVSFRDVKHYHRRRPSFA